MVDMVNRTEILALSRFRTRLLPSIPTTLRRLLLMLPAQHTSHTTSMMDMAVVDEVASAGTTREAVEAFNTATIETVTASKEIIIIVKMEDSTSMITTPRLVRRRSARPTRWVLRQAKTRTPKTMRWKRRLFAS